jgi:hypothetical protein
MISCAYFYARDGAYFYGTLNLFSLICGGRRGRWCRGGDSGDCDRRLVCLVGVRLGGLDIGESIGVGAARTAALVRIPLRERVGPPGRGGRPGGPTLAEAAKIALSCHQMIGAVWAYIYIYI